MQCTAGTQRHDINTPYRMDAFSYVEGSFGGASGADTARVDAERDAYLAKLERRLAGVARGRSAPPPAALTDPNNPAGMRALAREIGATRVTQPGTTANSYAAAGAGASAVHDDRAPLLLDEDGDGDALLVGVGTPDGDGLRASRERAAASGVDEPGAASSCCEWLGRLFGARG